MRSRASIGRHPVHPAIVPVPIGAFVVALLADVAYLATSRLFWPRMAGVALAIGIAGALISALPGIVDFSGLAQGSRVRAIATAHMLLNVAVVGLQSLSLYLRFRVETSPFEPGTAALALSFLAIALLGASGWLGGKMVFEHGAGVSAPPESTRERS
jgi:uncharacterized membrane protein